MPHCWNCSCHLDNFVTSLTRAFTLRCEILKYYYIPGLPGYILFFIPMNQKIQELNQIIKSNHFGSPNKGGASRLNQTLTANGNPKKKNSKNIYLESPINNLKLSREVMPLSEYNVTVSHCHKDMVGEQDRRHPRIQSASYKNPN